MPRNRIKIAIVIVGMILVAFAGWKMWHLALWGHWPLLFFTSLWFVLFFSFQQIFSKNEVLSKKAEILTIVTPVLLYLGFPDLPLFPLLFVGFVPLLNVLNSIEQSDIIKKKRTAWRYIFFSLLLWNILSTFWVANTSFIPSFVAFGLNSLFMSIPWILYFSFRRHLGKVLGPLALIAFWLSFEFLHMRWELTWSWLNLGNGMAKFPMLIQWYSITGVLGGSAWILALNLIAYHVIKGFLNSRKVSSSKLISLVSIIILPMILSAFMFYNYEEKGIPANITVIQPNFEPHYEKFSMDKTKQLKRFLQLSSASVNDSVRKNRDGAWKLSTPT